MGVQPLTQRPTPFPSIVVNFPSCLRPRGEKACAGGPRVALGWRSQHSHSGAISHSSCRCEWRAGWMLGGRQRQHPWVPALPPMGACLSPFPVPVASDSPSAKKRNVEV